MKISLFIYRIYDINVLHQRKFNYKLETKQNLFRLGILLVNRKQPIARIARYTVEIDTKPRLVSFFFLYLC